VSDRPAESRAYFFCVPSEGRAEVPYQHLLVCLAEGLIALGVRCYANVDYWPLDPERTRYLLRHDPAVGAGDCAIVIVSDDWFVTGLPLPERTHDDSCWVVLDRDDGSRLRSLTPPFRAYDVVLRTHYNHRTRYCDNFVPWAYGLSERMIAATRDGGAERRFAMLANWRHGASPHSVRLAVERSLFPRMRYLMPIDDAREHPDTPPDEPYERLWWRETGRRHWPAYYERLAQTAVCAAFGGYFVTRWPAAKESLVSRLLKRALTLSGRHTRLISQWDSWRLWESLAAGCATVHVDLERYGCVLPVMPVNWVHYIGIDLDRCEEAIERLRDEPELVGRVGAAGRAWALEHYGPRSTARRFLAVVGRSNNQHAVAAPSTSANASAPAMIPRVVTKLTPP
jgi:hypothetical protein